MSAEPQLMLPVVDPLEDAVEWAEKNPRAWHQFIEWAYEDMNHGHRPSAKLYAELLRRPHFANKLRLEPSDECYLINNTLTALLARLAMRRYPALVFPTRDARADWVLP